MAGGKKGGGSSKGTQADDGPKSKEKSKDAKSAPGRGGGDQKTDDHGAKKPEQNVRTLIGGASWTGKLPVTLFSEHCRKQKWDQPEYSMVWSAIILASSAVPNLTNIASDRARFFVSSHAESNESEDEGTDCSYPIYHTSSISKAPCRAAHCGRSSTFCCSFRPI